MFLVTIGIVYGDIGTSPMYVMKSILEGNGGITQIDGDFIIGSLSLVIWTITLLTTVKYVLIAMKADNHGEGGIFSLYSLVRDCGKWLIVPAMLGGAALLADGVLTPAVTVTTAVEGLRSIESMDRFLGAGQWKVVLITLFIITALFSVQHAGTSRIGKAFGPVMLLWFTFLGVTGAAHILSFPVVLKAFNPIYAVRVLLSPANKLGFMILGSVFLATTGAEALYSDMGHVGKENIYFSWPFVKLCLIVNYLGQGAWIIQSRGDAALAQVMDLNPFFLMLPELLRPFAVILGAAAAVIASQALITGSYTLVSEAILLDLLPHLEIRYPSDTKLCVYLRDLRKKGLLAYLMLLVFGGIETVFFISSLSKFMHGGYVTVILTLALLILEIIWYRGTQLERKYSTRLKMRDHIDSLVALHSDPDIPLLAHNLVYLDGERDLELMDRDILYSILDKDTKRAQAYWFVNVHVINEPKTMSYELETYGTDCIFRIRLNLGFKCSQRVNVYLRQIVQDLQARGELPAQDKRYSIYGKSTVGTFKFCIIQKSVTTKTELSSLDEFVLNTKYAIRRVAGSKERWYGLDTSSLILESVPLITGGGTDNMRIQRAESSAGSIPPVSPTGKS